MTTTPLSAPDAPRTENRLAEMVAACAAVPLRFLLTAALTALAAGACMLVTPWSGALRPDPSNPAAFGFAALVKDALVLLLAAAPVVALFRPVLATVLALTPSVVVAFYGVALPFAEVLALAAVMVCACWRRPGRALLPAVAALWLAGGVAWGMATMVVMDGSLIRMEGFAAEATTFASYAAAFLVLYIVGVAMRGSALRTRRLSTLTARAGQVEDQSAVVAERARLARDLHDVVAHHVSLIAVRAETAPYTHPALGEEARHLLAEIAGEARSALDELRGVLGVLRRDDGAAAERAPQPDLAGVAGLVERARVAGADVTLEGDVHAPVAAPVGYATYRLVQEALTNARRHAPGQPVRVVVLGEGERLRVRVSTPYLAASTAPRSSGGGLVGMRERVEALGGTLQAGVQGDLFVVEADLPRGAA